MVSFHILLLDRAGNNLVNADLSPYSRMFFAVKYIYLTLYIVCMCRTEPIYSVPLYLARSARLPVLAPASVCARGRARAWACARVWPCGRARPRALPCPCARLLMPGQRWTFLSAVPVRPALLVRVRARCGRRISGPIASGRSSCLRPCLPAPVPAPVRARPRACVRARVCVGARVAALAPVGCVILFAYMVDSPAVLPRAGLAANFFEIVFKPSIFAQPSSAGMGGTTLYCYMGCFVGVVMLLRSLDIS